jgi:hypothetical protein
MGWFRIETFDLLLTSLDHLLFVFKILFTSLTKQATLIKMSSVLSLSLKLISVPTSDGMGTERIT